MRIYYNTWFPQFGVCEASGTTAYLKAAEEHDARRQDQVAQPGSEV